MIAGPGPDDPPGAKPSVTYSFPKAGTYKLVCLFHYPVMNLAVVNPWVKNYLKHSDQFPTGQVGPELIYGTEPPGKYLYDGTNQGNGFLITKATDTSRFTPVPPSDQITFTKAGTYHYFCEIHGPQMSGDIVVG